MASASELEHKKTGAEKVASSDDVISELLDILTPPPVSTELQALFDAWSKAPAVNDELARHILIQSLAENQAVTGSRVLREGLALWADQSADASSSEMLFLVCCIRNLDVFAFRTMPTDVWEWVFATDKRVRKVAEVVSDEDDPIGMCRVLQRLYEVDAEGRDTFYNLMVALAVVWDTPRKEMHQQIGLGWMPPDSDVAPYYAYFKKLYVSSENLVPYEELSINSLAYVVDVPAPVSELEWALENVKGARGVWGKHYSAIVYDTPRLVLGQYSWPHREYSLKEIQECYGICVDQAYYSVITARAHGIPCLYFRGAGKFGGHAWFGFMKKPNEWNMDVARYSKQGYATGFAIHPQTDLTLTDHEIEYLCARSLNADAYNQSRLLARCAEILNDEGRGERALVCALEARTVDEACRAAWMLELDILLEQEKLREAIDLLDHKADVFDDFADIVTSIRLQQAMLLQEVGDSDAAEKLLRLEMMTVHSKRDDLSQQLVLAHVEQLLEQGEVKAAHKAMRRILKEQKDGGAKLYPFLVKYKALMASYESEKASEKEQSPDDAAESSISKAVSWLVSALDDQPITSAVNYLESCLEKGMDIPINCLKDPTAEFYWETVLSLKELRYQQTIAENTVQERLLEESDYKTAWIAYTYATSSYKEKNLRKLQEVKKNVDQRLLKSSETYRMLSKALNDARSQCSQTTFAYAVRECEREQRHFFLKDFIKNTIQKTGETFDNESLVSGDSEQQRTIRLAKEYLDECNAAHRSIPIFRLDKDEVILIQERVPALKDLREQYKTIAGEVRALLMAEKDYAQAYRESIVASKKGDKVAIMKFKRMAVDIQARLSQSNSHYRDLCDRREDALKKSNAETFAYLIRKYEAENRVFPIELFTGSKRTNVSKKKVYGPVEKPDQLRSIAAAKRYLAQCRRDHKTIPVGYLKNPSSRECTRDVPELKELRDKFEAANDAMHDFLMTDEHYRVAYQAVKSASRDEKAEANRNWNDMKREVFPRLQKNSQEYRTLREKREDTLFESNIAIFAYVVDKYETEKRVFPMEKFTR